MERRRRNTVFSSLDWETPMVGEGMTREVGLRLKEDEGSRTVFTTSVGRGTLGLDESLRTWRHWRVPGEHTSKTAVEEDTGNLQWEHRSCRVHESVVTWCQYDRGPFPRIDRYNRTIIIGPSNMTARRKVQIYSVGEIGQCPGERDG